MLVLKLFEILIFINRQTMVFKLAKQAVCIGTWANYSSTS